MTRLQEIALNIRFIIGQAPTSRVFGSNEHCFQLNEPISKEELESIEAKFGITLPELSSELDFDTFLQGSIVLAHQGCSYCDRLVVSGPQRGMVWSEYLGADGPIVPTGQSFVEWYVTWLRSTYRSLHPFRSFIERGYRVSDLQ